MRVLSFLAFLLPGEALAHVVDGHGWWNFDPWVWVPMLALVWLHALGMRRLPQRLPTSKLAGYALALAALFLALIWPLDVLADESFAAHMAQHMLLIAAAAPLLVYSDAGRVVFRALPAKRVFARLARPWHRLAHPRSAFALHAAAIWIGHAPLVVHWMSSYRAFHVLAHAVLLGSALLFWSALARLGRAGYGEAAVWTLATMIHTGILGALLTFAPRLLFAGYTLEDQQLAGLIMWVPGGMAYLVLGLAFTGAWLVSSERVSRTG